MDVRPSEARFSLESAADPQAPEARRVAGGLMKLCEEIACTLLRNLEDKGEAVAAVRATREALVTHLPDCDAERAGWLVDLALELLHVKAKGRFQRNALELSQLIARAGRQLRNLSDN